MADIDKIVLRIETLYKQNAPTQVDVPLALQARASGYFAKDYIAAASILDHDGPQHWLPLLQLTGHAVELSLKSCLASAGSAPPHGHDLVALYRTAQKLGFELDDSDFAALVHLHHFYFQDLSTQTKFKVRYPAKQSEFLGGSVPSNSTFASIVDKPLHQSEQKGGS